MSVNKNGLLSAIKEKLPEYEVEVIDNAEEALKKIYRNSFDLAILDMRIGTDELDSNTLTRECILMGKPIVVIGKKGSWWEKVKVALHNSDLRKSWKYCYSTDTTSIRSSVEGLIDKKISPLEVFQRDSIEF